MKKSTVRKLYNKHGRPHRRESHQGKRFYTRLDMAIIKRDQEVINSTYKRGEAKPKGGNHYIAVCGCGAEGCFIHGSFANEERQNVK